MRTPSISPLTATPGNLRPRPRRLHSCRALVSVARSTALNGILCDLSRCSRREVAVMIALEPAVREVSRYRSGESGS